MRIDSEPKLDFDDVLIRPKRTRLASRKQVDLVRTFKLPNSGQTITGVPIVAANMDRVATIEMAKALAEHKMFTAIHKHYSLDELKNADLSGEYNFITFGVEEIDVIKNHLDELKKHKINNTYSNTFFNFSVVLFM